MSNILRITRGNNEPWLINWPDDDGEAADLTSAEVDLFDNSLCPDFTVAITDAANGVITLTPVWPATDAGILAFPQTSYLRIRVTFSPDRIETSDRITVYAT